MAQPILSDLLSFLGSSVERWGDGDLFNVMWGGELRGMARVVGEPSDDTLPRIAADGIRYLGATQESFDAYQAHLARRYIAKVKRDGDACANIPGAEERLREQIVLLGRRVRNDLAAGALICDMGESPIALFVGSFAPLAPDLPKPTTKTLQRVDRAARRLAVREGDESVIDDQFVAPAKLDDAAGAHEAFAVVLGDIGEKGKEAARDIRAHAASLAQETSQLNRWAWLLPANGETARCHAALVRAAWLDVVRPQLERESERHPAVATPVMNMIATTLVREPNVRDRDDGSRTIVDHHGHAVATLLLAKVNAVPGRTVDELLASVARGMKKLGGLPSHRTLLWLVKKAAEQDVALVQNSRTITIEGGYARLADWVNASSKGWADDIRDIIEALSVMHVLTDTGNHNVLMRSFTRAAGHRPSVLTITLGEPLVAGWVHRLPQRDQQLVPLVDLCPTAWARDNERGPLCTARLHVVSRMRERASELAETGAVTFGRADWTQIGDLAQVPSKTLERAVEGEWLRDHDSDAPAFLSSPAEGRFRLAPAHQAAHLFLVEGGKLTITGRAAGQRSAQKRRGELNRRSGRRSDK